MSINERVKAVRSALNLTQKDFGEKLTLAQTYLSQIEKGDRDVTEKILKLICLTFNVSEEWLRTGAGEMFIETDKGFISALTAEYGLDTLDQKIVECYLNLGPLQRKVIKDYLRSLVDAVLSDESYDEYREGYIKENASAVAARGGHSEQIGELKDLYDNGDSEEK